MYETHGHTGVNTILKLKCKWERQTVALFADIAQYHCMKNPSV